MPFAAACGGGGEGPGPADDMPARVVVLADLLTPQVYDRVSVVVQVRASDGRTLSGVEVRWRSTRSDIARVEQDGTVEAVAVGEAVVIASAGDVSDEIADTVLVRVRPPAAASLQVSPAELTLGVGVTHALSITVRDQRGAPIADAASVMPSPGPISVTGSSVRGTGPGVASVIVRAGNLADTVPVRVVAGLPGALDVFEIAPAMVVRLTSEGLAGARVTVGGAEAAITPQDEGSVKFLVPRSPWEPCRPAGGTIELAITTGGGVSRAIVGAGGLPVIVTLAPGQHAIERSALLGGCDVAVAAEGDYLVMPFSWDGATPGGPVAVRVSVLPASPGIPLSGFMHLAPQADGSEGGGGRSPPAQRPLPDRAQAWDVIDLADPARGGRAPAIAEVIDGPTVGESCPIPTTPGATIPLGTTRDSRGYVALVLRGSPTESWTLAAISPHLAVFFDTTLVRVSASEPLVMQRLARFVAAYDSTVVPLFDRYTTGIPDADGNRRVVMLAPFGVDGFAYAMPNGYGRPDCTYGAAGGEAFMLRSNYMLTNPGPNLATSVSLAAHETAHLVDHKGTLSDRQGSAWSGEGFATQFNWLWAAGSAGAPYSSNRSAAWTRLVEGTGTGYSCVDPQRATWAALRQLANGTVSYTSACAMVRSMIARGIARGLSERDALMKFIALRRRATFADAVNEYDNTARPPEAIAGEWLMMWFADDFVSGTSPALQDPAMNWRSAWTLSPWPLPEASLSPGDSVEFGLGEPDVRHYQAALPPYGRVRYRQTNGAPVPQSRAALGLLRIR